MSTYGPLDDFVYAVQEVIEKKQALAEASQGIAYDVACHTSRQQRELDAAYASLETAFDLVLLARLPDLLARLAARPVEKEGA